MCDAMMRDVWPSADARLRSRPSYACGFRKQADYLLAMCRTMQSCRGKARGNYHVTKEN